jgi:[ribosomal protein S5]-alanine N-acetyltransferase
MQNRRLVTTSSRLELWEIQPSDEATFLKIYQDPIMMTHLGGPMPLELAEQRFQKWLGIIAHSQFGPCCVVTYRGQSDVIATVGIFPSEIEGELVLEIGWTVLTAHQQKGIAFEAAQALDRYASAALGAHVLVALPGEANTASNRICEKLGMRRVKLVSYPYGDKVLQMVYWRRDKA